MNNYTYTQGQIKSITTEPLITVEVIKPYNVSSFAETSYAEYVTKETPPNYQYAEIHGRVHLLTPKEIAVYLNRSHSLHLIQYYDIVEKRWRNFKKLKTDVTTVIYNPQMIIRRRYFKYPDLTEYLNV